MVNDQEITEGFARESIPCRDVRNPNDWRPTAAKLSPLSLWPGTLQYHRYSFNASFPCQEGDKQGS